MLRLKTIIWMTFAFCVSTGSCADLFKKIGDEVQMECGVINSGTEVQWKVNDTLLISKFKSGRERKGQLETSSRARIDKTSLKITSLKTTDNGVYTCGNSNSKLYVASASVYPSSVLYNDNTTLKCDVAGDFKGTYDWLSPSNIVSNNKPSMILKSVTSETAGKWTCKIKDEKKFEKINLTVVVAVVGPLSTPKELNITEGRNAELLCSLPAQRSLPIIGGSWTRRPSSDIHVLGLTQKDSSLEWNSTSKRLTFSKKELNSNFSVTIKKVKPDDAGVYVCSLNFQGGKSLSSELKLSVQKNNGLYPDYPTVTKNSIWYKPFSGLQLWIWIAIGVSILVLITLVVVIVLIHRRNKRMRRKMKKMQSMRQPLATRNYCKCDRTVRQPPTGKRERPPPLPRHQYTSLNE